MVASYLGNLFNDMKIAFEKGDLEDARKHQVTCADPENFVRGGPTKARFLEGREDTNKYHYKRAIVSKVLPHPH